MSEGVKGVKTVKAPSGFPPLEPPSTFTYRIFISYRTQPQRTAPADPTRQRGVGGSLLLVKHVMRRCFPMFLHVAPNVNKFSI